MVLAWWCWCSSSKLCPTEFFNRNISLLTHACTVCRIHNQFLSHIHYLRVLYFYLVTIISDIKCFKVINELNWFYYQFSGIKSIYLFIIIFRLLFNIKVPQTIVQQGCKFFYFIFWWFDCFIQVYYFM